MTSSRRFDRLLQAGCLGLIGMLAAAGCGGSSSGKTKDAGFSDGSASGEVGPSYGAQLTVNPPSVDFGSIDVGAKSTAVAVTVTNVGTITSGPLGVTVSGTGISATGCSGTTLAPKATCTLSVTAQMAVAGPISGMIEVGDTPATTKKIQVTGVATIPGQFTLSPAPLDLGEVNAGAKTTGTVIMTNAAQTGLTGILINVSGTGYSAGTGTCTEVLAVGQTCNIVVNFTAGTTSGVAKGTVTVSQGGVTKYVAVSAKVQTPAKLVMAPPSASFPTTFGKPSTAVTFYVTNSGDVTSAIPTVSITGTNKDDFSQTNSCATALPGGATASCQITVIYNPKTQPTGNATATLMVAEPGTGGSSATSTLTGIAVAPSTLEFSGAETDFGTVVVGTTSAPLTFTLTNKGGDDSGLIALSTAAPFSFVTDNCTDKNLAAKATCTFTAQFKPAEGDAGVIQGQFKAVGASVANPALFFVTGNAVPKAKLAVNPKSLEFGSLPYFQESTAQTLTFSNTGAAPTGILKVENTGAQFAVKGDNCKGLSLTAAGSANSSCTIIVTFTSAATDMDATGSIVVTDTTGAAGSASATLHGVGTPPADLTFTPSIVCPEWNADDKSCHPTPGTPLTGHASAGWRFLNMVVGQTTQEMVFTLTNNTAPTMAPDSGALKFEITGEAAADFAIVKSNCTAPLISTGGTPTSCALTMTFKPSALGLRKALLQVSTSRGGAAQSTLEGKGLPVVELQPLVISQIKTGLDFGQVPLGQDGGTKTPPKNFLPYRVWVRDTTAADDNTTVTVTLPKPNPADFVYPTTGVTMTIVNPDDMLTPTITAFSPSASVARATNPCDNKTLSLAFGPDGKLTQAAKDANTVLGYSCDDRGYCYCDFAVQFYPQSARGALSANLSAAGSGGGTSQLTLTGTASGPLTVNPSPATLRDPVAVGTASNTLLTLTIANESATVDMTNLSFAMSGTGAADFQIIWTDCWGDVPGTGGTGYANIPAVTLHHGDSCYVYLGFEPKTEGAYSVSFTATAANGAGTADDEVGTATIIANSAKTFGFLTLTAGSAFAEVPFKTTGATPVTFTLTNTGTLDASELTYTAVGDVDELDFERIPSAGVAGACSESTSYVLAGGSSCTIQVRPTPKGTPDGERRKLVLGKLIVTSKAGVGALAQTYTVRKVLSYYETSNIMVRDTGDLAPVVAYGFPAAGLNSQVLHNFIVSNIGTTPVGLTFDWAPYPGIGTLPFNLPPNLTTTPVQCVAGANTLAAGASCTLVVRSSNTVAGVIPAEKPVTLTIKDFDAASPTNLAKLKLSSATGTAANLIKWGVDRLPTVAPYSVIDLGSVPFANAGVTFRGGVATVSFKNDGGTATQPLSFKMTVTGPDITGTAVTNPVTATSQDLEFKINNLTEQLVAPLAPGEVRSVQVQFIPSANRPTVGARTAILEVLESGGVAVPLVELLAYSSANQSVYVQDDASTNIGFVQFSTITPENGTTVNPEVKTLTVYNGSTASQTVTLAFQAGNANFALTTAPSANACVDGPNTLAAGGYCKVNVIFTPQDPGTDSERFVYSELLVGGVAPVQPIKIGLIGRVEVPVTLDILKSVSAAGCTAVGPQVPATDCVSLGTVGVGAAKQQTLTVVNVGDVGMPAAGAGLLTGFAAAPAVVGATWTLVNDGCNAQKLAANATCTITLNAVGAALTPYPTKAEHQVTVGSAAVTTVTYAAQVEVLSAPDIKVDGSGIFTTNVPVTGFNTDMHSFLIYNGTDGLALGTVPQNVPTGVLSVSITGTDADQFAITANNLSPNLGLEGGEAHRTVTVAFRPTRLSAASSAFSATLNLFDANVSATVPVKTVTLQGTSISALAFSPEGAGTELPKTQVMAGVTQSFTVSLLPTATATTPLKTSIVGADFVLVDDWCYGKILSDAGSCTMTVKYTGLATTTAKTATISVDGGGAVKSASVKVSYTGAAATSH